MNFNQLFRQYKAKVMEVNAHAFTGNATQQGYKQEMMVQVVELISVGRLPSKTEIMSYNAQQTYGSILAGLFGCDVIVEGATDAMNKGEETIHFSLPTDCHWSCFVKVMVTGCSEGRIKCTMSESELSKQLEYDYDLANCGI